MVRSRSLLTNQKVYEFVTDPAKITSIFPDVQDVKVIDANNFTLKAKVGISVHQRDDGCQDEHRGKGASEVSEDERRRGTGMSSSVELDNTFTIEHRPRAQGRP